MKKITLSVALLIGILTSNAQDTICTMVRLHEVVNFNHRPTEIISRYDNNEDVVIEVGPNKILCLHLYDEKYRLRKVTNYYEDGTTFDQILDSKRHVYYSTALDIVKVKVTKPMFIRQIGHTSDLTTYIQIY
tara:strand:- start:221 stop:616 length:396 start_codon:yes stop_codon:yes gene_type:complete